jgi:excisionase family DNA binding protein
MEQENDLITTTEAAEYMHVTKQAIYISIYHKRITAFKKKGQWLISKAVLDDYRLNKYNRDLRKINGEYVFDMEKGHFSLNQVCKAFSQALSHPYRIQRLYYLIRVGRLKAFKKGAAWVIHKQDAIDLLKIEQQEDNQQLSIV